MSKQNGALVKKESQAEAPAIVGLLQLERAADYIVKSKLFGVQTKEQAVALMLLAQAEGIHPMRAIQEYHIIQGRPAMRADAMLARFLAAGGKVVWHELSDEAAEATFKHPAGGEVRIRWDMERAKKAGLLDKQGSNWQRYPRAMLRARVISEGIRTVYPNVIVGVYTPEEVQDFDIPEVVEAEVVQEDKPQGNGNGRRAELTQEFKEVFEALGWTPDQGKAFLKKHFGKESARELSDMELARAIGLMRRELKKRESGNDQKSSAEQNNPQGHDSARSEELEKVWREIYQVIQQAGFKWEGVKEYIKSQFGKDNPDTLTLQEAKALLSFLKEQAGAVASGQVKEQTMFEGARA